MARGSDSRSRRERAAWSLVWVVLALVGLHDITAAPGHAGAPGSSPSRVASAPTTSPVVAASHTFLAEMGFAHMGGGVLYVGPAAFHGMIFPHSLWFEMSCAGGGADFLTYDLGRHWTTFETAIGIKDDSLSTAHTRFAVYADGVRAFSQNVASGQSVEIRLNVARVSRLRIAARPTSCYPPGSMLEYPVFGTAELKLPI